MEMVRLLNAIIVLAYRPRHKYNDPDVPEIIAELILGYCPKIELF